METFLAATELDYTFTYFVMFSVVRNLNQCSNLTLPHGHFNVVPFNDSTAIAVAVPVCDRNHTYVGYHQRICYNDTDQWTGSGGKCSE